MNPQLLEKLSVISPEEQAILDGRTTIDRELYSDGSGSVINSRKLLSAGKLITIRPHTRFIHFPAHHHDYVELVYMCAGETTHLVNGKKLLLRQGELLFLTPSALHEVCRAEQGDIAVNFIVLPDFFSTTFAAIGEETTSLRQFLVDCLCGQNSGAAYLHFSLAHVQEVQNLVENLILTLLSDTPHKRQISQMTMALLFLQLLDHTDSLTTGLQEKATVLQVLRYVETRYRDGTLAEIADILHYDISWLSREIKHQTGKTYTQLVQEKRLAQAAFLLKTTEINIADISAAVGYENVSYFHKLFTAANQCSPGHYRSSCRARKDTF